MPAIGFIIGHAAIEAGPACMCSIMWDIMPCWAFIMVSRIVRLCATISVTAAAVAAGCSMLAAAFILVMSVSSR